MVKLYWSAGLYYDQKQYKHFVELGDFKTQNDINNITYKPLTEKTDISSEGEQEYECNNATNYSYNFKVIHH